MPPVGLTIVYKIVLHQKFDELYNWYMPTDQEVANAVIHRADARKNRLHKRFGNPALHNELFTPMIHKRSQHLLRQIYSGRMAEDDYIRHYEEEAAKSGVSNNTTETGGLAFKAIGEEDLEQSREAYLREQDAWETASLSTAANGDSTPFYRGDAAQGYFEAKKREYLVNGPQSRTGTPDGYEMARIPSDNARPGESREDLLDGGGSGTDRARGGTYGHRQSNSSHFYQDRYTPAGLGSFEDVGLAYGPNESGYFDPGRYSAQQAPGYQQMRNLPPAAAPYQAPAPSYQYPPGQQQPTRQTSPWQSSIQLFDANGPENQRHWNRLSR